MIENYPYRDPLGRETVTFVREYRIGAQRRRRFDATMILDEGRSSTTSARTSTSPSTSTCTSTTAAGSLLTSDAQRFYEGPIGFRFPMLFSGRARLREYYDDTDERFHVDLEVHNHWFGFLFGYRGSFTCEWMPATDAPARLKPLRHEART